MKKYNKYKNKMTILIKECNKLNNEFYIFTVIFYVKI